jgi:hypothetical protein
MTEIKTKTDERSKWTVIEVDGRLVASNSLRAFEVMRVSDHDEVVDMVIDKAASAVTAWREKAEALASTSAPAPGVR